jgi:hypothetical protein
VIKIASTTLGETGADMFSMGLDLGYATSIAMFLVVFLVLLAVKLSRPRYDPVSYWTLFTSTAILGTAISDFIDRTLGLGYTAGSALLVTLLVITLAVWRLVEGSVSVERIEDRRGELFYWAAFLIANTRDRRRRLHLGRPRDRIPLQRRPHHGRPRAPGARVLLHSCEPRAALLARIRPDPAIRRDVRRPPDQVPREGRSRARHVLTSLFFAIAMAIALVREARAERRPAG